MSQKVVLIACGSFSPPTIFHVKIFEEAKIHMEKNGYSVLGGIISPVHQKYEKKTLAPQHDRIHMAQLAVSDHPWVIVSTYECDQEDWTPTTKVLNHYANDVKNIKVMFLCGGDVLETFPNINQDGTPVWCPTDQIDILKNGMVCICRKGFDLDKLCEKSEIIAKYKNNIIIVPIEENTVSSTKVRKMLQNGEDYSGLVHPKVKTYMEEKKLKNLEQWN